jgi:(p)ppGpp synthase/HD superfamily hydrolase
VTLSDLGSQSAIPNRSGRDPPEWITDSGRLAAAYSLAQASHGEQRRASDGRYFLEHVVEVAGLLHRAGFDDELVAVGLLHDAVERGTLSRQALRGQMGASIASLVLALSEDAEIASFDWRKAGLRRQVERAGGLAVTVYAADKLSDIRGLRRGIEIDGDGLAERLGTSVASMTAHYRESVEMIESVKPGSVFLPALRLELARLEAGA